MGAMISRPPLSDRLTSSKVIAVLRAPHVSALTSVCDVLVEEEALDSGAQCLVTPTIDLPKGGDLSALRDRCRAVRAVIDETMRS